MIIGAIQPTLYFAGSKQHRSASCASSSPRSIYDPATSLPFDPGENAVGSAIELNGDSTYFYDNGDGSGEIVCSTTYRGKNVVKRAKYDTTTGNKIKEEEYVNGGVYISVFDEASGNITKKSKYDASGFLFEENTFDPKTRHRTSNLVYDPIDQLCYTYREFDPVSGSVISTEKLFKAGKEYKTEKKEFPLKRRVS